MTDFETKCKPRVAGPGPQPWAYMIQVLYIYDPGNHLMTSFEITKELIIIYKTLRSEYEADIISFQYNDSFRGQM